MPEPDVPISALEHYSYCPRQCALIHVERTFDENIYTVRGTLAHERVHAGEAASSRGVRVLRGIELWSEVYGLRGRADAIELHGTTPYPIEYKVGSRLAIHALLQLCAQAFCLEEMTGELVSRGAIYSGATRRRREIVIDEPLRDATIAAIVDVRRMLVEQLLPPPVNDARCPHCSLVESCLPTTVGAPHRLRGLQGALFQPWNETCTSS